MSSQSEPKYEGWGAFGPDSVKGNFKWFEYEPKTFCDDDIECRFGLSPSPILSLADTLSQDPILWCLCF
jgi:hypothetical protein